MSTRDDIPAEMQLIIMRRVEAIRQAHANNLIEGIDAGEEEVAAMIERAREPISNEEFTRRERILFNQRFPTREE